MLDFLERFKSSVCVILTVLGGSLAALAAIGGHFHVLDAGTVGDWFCLILAAFFAVTLVIALVTFLLWFFFGEQRPYLLIFVGVVILVLVVVLLTMDIFHGQVWDLQKIIEDWIESLNK